MRTLGYVLASLLGAAIALVAAQYVRVEMPMRLAPDESSFTFNLSYTDFLTVMFAGATLVLASVALIVGLVAVFTYQGLKSEARRTIRDKVDQQVVAIDERIEREVQHETEEKLTIAIERAGRDGKLDQALQKALIAIGMGETKLSGELETDFAPGEDYEER